MVPYARLLPGRGFSPARAGFYYAQRLAAAPQLRRPISRAIASVIRLRRGGEAGPSLAPDYATVGPGLKRDGIAMLPPALVPQALASRILEHFRGERVVLADGRRVPLGGVPPGTAQAPYPLSTILQSPDVLGLVNAPAVLRVASDYLGCKPTLSSLGMRWSLPGGRAVLDTQQFHRDPDDWLFLKLFVYLSDVDADSGPHTYVAGSHRTAGQIRERPYAEAAVRRAFGAGAIRTITGPRGTAFMADTYGIHAGAVPKRAPRLILQAQYSLLPIFAFRYDPISIDAPLSEAQPLEARPLEAQPLFDRYVNRLLVSAPRPA